MFREMRKNTKIILWVVAIAFVGMIVFSWGMNITGIRSNPQTGVIGKVNGEKISYERFRNALQRAYQQEEKQSKEIDEKKLINQTWNSLIINILLSQQLKKENITVSDQEVINYIKNNPPKQVRNIEAFHTDGKFDTTKYLNFLKNPSTYKGRVRAFLERLESFSRNALKLQKLRSRIINSVKVTTSEVKQRYIRQNQKVKVEYVFAGPQEVKDTEVNITKKEVQDYYTDHKEDFATVPKRSGRFVLFKKKPSPADQRRVREKIKEIYSKLKGEKFTVLAKKFSEDQLTAPKGGDLGWITKDDVEKKFWKEASALKPGEISDPVKTKKGWHIIKLTDRRKKDGKQQIRASHILRRLEPSSETIKELKEKAQRFSSQVTKENFKTLAEKYGVKVKNTGFFAKGNYIPGIGKAKPLVKFAFESEIGEVSAPFENDQGFFLFQLRKINQKGIKPLSEVEDQIKRKIKGPKKKKLVQEKIKKAAKMIEKGANLKEAAQANSLEYKKPKPFSMTDYVPEVGRENKFITTAFSLEPDKTSGIIKTNRGYYIIHLIEKEPINQEEFQKHKERLRKQLLSQKRNLAYFTWLRHLRRNAEIVDNRERFYDIK